MPGFGSQRKVGGAGPGKGQMAQKEGQGRACWGARASEGCICCGGHSASPGLLFTWGAGSAAAVITADIYQAWSFAHLFVHLFSNQSVCPATGSGWCGGWTEHPCPEPEPGENCARRVLSSVPRPCCPRPAAVGQTDMWGRFLRSVLETDLVTQLCGQEASLSSSLGACQPRTLL